MNMNIGYVRVTQKINDKLLLPLYLRIYNSYLIDVIEFMKVDFKNINEIK